MVGLTPERAAAPVFWDAVPSVSVLAVAEGFVAVATFPGFGFLAAGPNSFGLFGLLGKSAASCWAPCFCSATGSRSGAGPFREPLTVDFEVDGFARFVADLVVGVDRLLAALGRFFAAIFPLRQGDV
ncbi:MAG: hypothetical protein ABR609_13110 [Acidimicrobiia bacterium]